ncbi:5-formyltetrahydrofolate cyclo-ligase [Clostridium grantii]|uniref:5-formyltetrahydrofolate cyclo-ligase n=1 Tax=Clostridium grantii DSM 8605 TaxID=1121316 RepID=A0A1M5RF45_9CLOT|nr:5-formyltetrahydrofolate cyclo-ligase [Clostridium grantii]SHH24992.1 5-formyltetrahydrofolate cyclo-ligase [Clostridium grantii DSM 8605]
MKWKAKNIIRQEIIEKRNLFFEQNPEEKNARDEFIFNEIINNKQFINANTIFTYVSFGSEIDTQRLINYALSIGKNICVPKVFNKQKVMKAYKISSLKELNKSNYGILEPFGDNMKEVLKENIDLAIFPGIAFDNKGGRIGYGGGYYDKFFSDMDYLNFVEVEKKDYDFFNKEQSNKVVNDVVSKFSGEKIGLAYQFQLIDDVPMEKYDVKVDYLIIG